MKKIVLLVLHISLTGLFLHAQEWSDPTVINPTQSDRILITLLSASIMKVIFIVSGAQYMDHFLPYLVSKSEDDGETWTPLYNVSQNNSKWMSEPQIVSDNQGMIHLTYADDVGNF